jgi:hypothetical protein
MKMGGGAAHIAPQKLTMRRSIPHFIGLIGLTLFAFGI